MELTVFSYQTYFHPDSQAILSEIRKLIKKIISILYTKTFRFNELQSNISYVTMSVLNTIRALPFNEPQSNNMLNDFPTHS